MSCLNHDFSASSVECLACKDREPCKVATFEFCFGSKISKSRKPCEACDRKQECFDEFLRRESKNEASCVERSLDEEEKLRINESIDAKRPYVPFASLAKIETSARPTAAPKIEPMPVSEAPAPSQPPAVEAARNKTALDIALEALKGVLATPKKEEPELPRTCAAPYKTQDDRDKAAVLLDIVSRTRTKSDRLIAMVDAGIFTAAEIHTHCSARTKRDKAGIDEELFKMDAKENEEGIIKR